jgi:hypothetical protein
MVIAGNPPSLNAVFNQRECFAAFEIAIYLVFVVELDTDFYFYDFLKIVQILNLNK